MNPILINAIRIFSDKKNPTKGDPDFGNLQKPILISPFKRNSLAPMFKFLEKTFLEEISQ